MIHKDVLKTIKKDRQNDKFQYPYYGKYSISEISPSILELFNVNQPRNTLPMDFFKSRTREHNKVILFMVDGMGYDHFLEYHKSFPFFGKLEQNADIFPITSVFPSTTPAALTSIHTGLTPQEHGLPEWTVYFEEFDKIIETFPFRPIMTSEREILLSMGGTPEMLYQGTTVYQQLKDNNIKSYVFISHEYSTSAYSRMTQQGSNVVAFIDYKDLFSKLTKILNEEKEPAYFFVYWSHIDSTQHVFGPRSKEHIASMQSFSDYMMDDFLPNLRPESVKDVLFTMVADHGHTSIRGEDIIFLNNYLPLENNYLRSPAQLSIQPTGSPHDVFLHIYEPRIKETLEFLQKELKDKAVVMTSEEAIEKGLFGLNKATSRFKKRVGDILILPYRGFHVWYKHNPGMNYGQKGIHGGLTEEEMIVPFAVAPLSDLL